MKGKITKRGEGCEGEAFTLIMQVIKELRAKGEEVKAKIVNSLMRVRAREGDCLHLILSFTLPSSLPKKRAAFRE